MVLSFSQTADRIAATTKKLEKTAIVAEYLKSLPEEDAARAALFLSGRAFPAHEQSTLGMGGSLLWQVIAELSGKTDAQLHALYKTHGDLGDVAAGALPEREPKLKLADIDTAFRQIAAARGPGPKSAIVRELLARATPRDAKYVVKIITGDLRIGLKESLVEEAIAKGYGLPLAEVQRANMLLGDIGATLKLAATNQLGEARMRLFHPIDFMLASPAETAEDALSYFPDALVEDKYDGIRAQAHIANGEVRIFSRTRDDITSSFPELPDALAGLPEPAILDGEIVAWSMSGTGGSETARALPFSVLQQRLGRKKVSEKMLHEIPVAYLVFDVLYAGNELLLNVPLRERGKVVDRLLADRKPTMALRRETQSRLMFGEEDDHLGASVVRAPVFSAHSAEELEALFTAAQARGNEGLMIKDPNSLYTPGRRGKSWLKMKKELATLDVVVTAVEYGHGKRIGVLSDYTFAVWDGDRLVNIGKAYSGLTDAEIAEMTKWFLAHTLEDHGMRLVVEPSVVLEVAFNNMMVSTRHESGYALRFPRIVRIRNDKLPQDADTLETAKKIFDRQKWFAIEG
ncbi:MAG TPA: ATP-dependent DNA ligase [Terriglobales bacterium]|jgi:DNA ligase 1|nr:ATP-dependent DNA ligase [Terriglobales bacterium]